MRILYNTSNNSIVDYPRFDNEDVLDYLLSESDNPFTQEEKESWISLANSYHVPLANL